MLPTSPRRISASVSRSPFVPRSSTPAMIIPGVQKPHWSAWCSQKASWSGWSSPSRARPSIVVISLPSAWTASTVHDFTASPSRWIVQAPQTDVSQPIFFPVSPRSSRRKSTSSVRGSTSASCRTPLTVSAIGITSASSRTRALAAESYLPDRGLATAIYLAVAMQRPLLLEGEAGVGKTEVGKTLARVLGAELIRLQCYEGIDSAQALYEWDYARQLLYARELQAGEVREHVSELYGPEFLVERPLLRALRAGSTAVLLVDEVDRADDEPPVAVVTSNRTRELHDALKRRCLYQWIEFPSLALEVESARLRAPEV